MISNFSCLPRSDDFLKRFFDEDVERSARNALEELRGGMKRTCWIWYVFPQLRAAAGSHVMSATSYKYAFPTVRHAQDYINNPVLVARYRAVLTEVHRHVVKLHANATTLMGGSAVDVSKLVSSLTLFEAVGPDDVSRMATAVLDALALTPPRCKNTVAELMKP